MPKINSLSDQEIETELRRILSSDDDDDEEDLDENGDTFALTSSTTDIDARLNRIQSFTYSQLITVLSDNEDTLAPDVSMQPHPIVDEKLPDNSMLSVIHVEEPTLETVSEELMIPPGPAEELSLAVISGEPLPSYTELLNKDRQWSDSCTNFSAPDFCRPMSVIKQYNNRSTPLTYFQDMFTKELITSIVRNTNIYAAYKNSNHWKDTSFEEISAYMGMVVLMSINPISDIKLYWSTDEFYNNQVISRVMPYKRFQKITENFHVSNILDEKPRTDMNYDKLCKVRSIINSLNETFEKNCTPSQYNSIDESMIKFKGRSSMKQYMPKKPIKRGYKCWCRCDSKTGYLYCFQIYTGKTNNPNEEGLGCRVVTDLCQNVPKNTLVAFDNFFTSLPLMEILYSKEIYAVGTIRINRKGLPDEISKKNKELKLKPGEFVFKYSHPITCIKWMDTKEVFVVTTAFNPKEVEVIKRTQRDGTKKNMYCPTAIKKYTDYMGGVDLFDHYRSSYPLGRKSRKYWHRIFWFLFEAAVVNSFIVYHQKSTIMHKDFRLRLGRLLINNFTTKKINTPVFKNKKGGIYGVPNEVRLLNVGDHMPQDNFKFRRCRFCSTRVTEKRSRFVCKTCKVPICPECFDNFHK